MRETQHWKKTRLCQSYNVQEGKQMGEGIHIYHDSELFSSRG